MRDAKPSLAPHSIPCSVPDSHPSFDSSLLAHSPEHIVYQFVVAGDLRIDEDGQVWRLRKKVGGLFPRFSYLDPPTLASNVLATGRRQIQVYVTGVRVVCLTARLVWFSKHGEIPEGCHVHHKNNDLSDERPDSLLCMDGKAHIANHGKGRPAWNKGIAYGLTPGFLKAIAVRRANHEQKCKETLHLWRSGLSASDVAKVTGVCTRQVYTRLQSAQAADNL